MKRTQAFFVVVFGVAGLAGCSTTPVERQEHVAQSLNEVKTGMVATRNDIDKALGSLNALVTAPSDRIPQAYARYAEDVDRLKQSSSQVQENAQQMREQRDNWLAAWRESHDRLQNDELKQVSQERREQVASRFDRISDSFGAAQEAFQPFIENLDDIRTVVGNDLTRNGIAAVANTDVVQNARMNGAEVEQNLEAAIGEFSNLTNALRPLASP